MKCYWKTTAGYTKQKSNCVAEGKTLPCVLDCLGPLRLKPYLSLRFSGGPGKPSCSPLPGEMGLGGDCNPPPPPIRQSACLFVFLSDPGLPLRTARKCSVLATKAVEIPGKSSVLATEAVKTQGKGGVSLRLSAPADGHYQGHWMSATAFLYNTTGNATIKVRHILFTVFPLSFLDLPLPCHCL